MTTDTLELLDRLIETSLRLIEDDTDNSDRHQRIAAALARYGRKRYGPRFGDTAHKPMTPCACLDEDVLDELLGETG